MIDGGAIALDSSAYSAFMRDHEAITEWIRHASAIRFSTIVLGELHYGFRRCRDRAQNLSLLEKFLAHGAVGIVDIDAETALRYAEIRDWLRTAGTPIPANDIWIAASAMRHGHRLITTDHHFAHVPQVSAEIMQP